MRRSGLRFYISEQVYKYLLPILLELRDDARLDRGREVLLG